MKLGNDMVGLLNVAIYDNGELLEATQPGHPMAYLHAKGTLPPAVEEALEGAAIGDTVESTVPNAYGERIDREPLRVKRNQLPTGRDWQPGMVVYSQQPDGPIALYIVKTEGAWVWLEVNHPWAGKTLTFQVDVVDVRPATSEELAHGHAHGPGGHHHH